MLSFKKWRQFFRQYFYKLIIRGSIRAQLGPPSPAIDLILYLDDGGIKIE